VERPQAGDGASPGRRINHKARYEPSPCPSPSPCPDARRPRSSTTATRSRPRPPPRASSRRSHRPPTLRAFGAPADYIRARPHPPLYMGSRRFRTSGRVFLPPLGRYGRTAYPSSLQSEKRTQRPKLVAIAKPPLRSGFAGPRAVLQHPRSARRLRRPRRCRSGPLLRPAIRRNLARTSAHHLTTSRVPRDEALRNSATPTGVSEGAAGALVGQASRLPAGWVGSKSEIRNLSHLHRGSSRQPHLVPVVNAAGTAAPQDDPDWCALFVAGVSPTGWVRGKFEIRNSKFEISRYRKGCRNLSHRGR
jgi:hypothetical protein